MPGQRRVQVLSAHLVTTPRTARLSAQATAKKGRGGNAECADVAGDLLKLRGLLGFREAEPEPNLTPKRVSREGPLVLSVDDDLARHMVAEGLLGEACDVELVVDGEEEQGAAPSPDLRRLVEDACASLGVGAEERETSDGTVAFALHGSPLEDEHGFKFGLAPDGHRVTFVGGVGAPSQWDRAQARLFSSAWNRDKEFFKAHVDDDGDLAVVMDVDLGHVTCDLEDMKHFVCLFEDGISIFVLDVARMVKQASPGSPGATLRT
mmetsp:Transcript_15068/g.41262  ORF Transcript_15068/g.41262 Transcript_15068/m.41262 type:complete len:264 (-) Transcript_15068:174-965(-)